MNNSIKLADETDGHALGLVSEDGYAHIIASLTRADDIIRNKKLKLFYLDECIIYYIQNRHGWVLSCCS